MKAWAPGSVAARWSVSASTCGARRGGEQVPSRVLRPAALSWAKSFKASRFQGFLSLSALVWRASSRGRWRAAGCPRVRASAREAGAGPGEKDTSWLPARGCRLPVPNTHPKHCAPVCPSARGDAPPDMGTGGGAVVADHVQGRCEKARLLVTLLAGDLRARPFCRGEEALRSLPSPVGMATEAERPRLGAGPLLAAPPRPPFLQSPQERGLSTHGSAGLPGGSTRPLSWGLFPSTHALCQHPGCQRKGPPLGASNSSSVWSHRGQKATQESAVASLPGL